MSVYTPPALNAVDFPLAAFTPADITPYEIELSSYTRPALNAVDFALVAFTLPTFPDVGWELLPSSSITGTASYGQGSGTSDGVASLNFTGTSAFGQGSGTLDAVAALGFSGTSEFGQGSGTFDAVANTASVSPQTYGGAGPSRKRIKHAVEELRRRRPKPLTHEVALAATVKKVAKKAQIPIHDAQLAVNMAVFQLSEDVSFRLAANLARSHTPTTKADDALIRAFWADVAERAVEMDDEEYLFLTML